jgi:3-isopropylmalate/(R)-2-methylmalate dehydratase small subunit
MAGVITVTALVTLKGIAASLMLSDINTDTIAPLVRAGQGLQPAGIRSSSELAQRLFGPWRYAEDGQENADFVLNKTPFREAKFLIAGDNFACGSSRETAATMLQAFGIRCIIAPSFGLIFKDNCFRNHMLPLVLPSNVIEKLSAMAQREDEFLLNLTDCTLKTASGFAIEFSLPIFRQEMLLKGTDEVSTTLNREQAINQFEAVVSKSRPWEQLAR